MTQDYSDLGAIANATGQRFEAQLIESCDRYFEEGVADIIQCRPASLDVPYSVRLKGVSRVDFDGELLGHPEPRHIAFDAKSISKNSTYSHGHRDRHQVAYLLQLQRKGHLGFILLYDKNLDMLWLLMDVIRLLEPPEWVDVRSVKEGRVHSYLPQVKRRDGVWDFMPVALAEQERLGLSVV